MRDTDIAYIAGLFDGEGSVDYVKRTEKKKKHKGKVHRRTHIAGVLLWSIDND